MTKRWRYSLLALAGSAACLGLIFVANYGCGSRPRAPALLDEPVYTNMQEGFRFVVPEGWQIQARAEYPRQEMKEERMLVEYRRQREGKTLLLLVSMVDLPETASLRDHIVQRVYPAADWKVGPVETIQLGDVPAERLVLSLRVDKEETIREVVSVRKAQRVYFFSGSFPGSDTKGREEIRKAVASLTWER